MDVSGRFETELGLPAVGILAVLSSVVGLQLGGATTKLLDGRVSVAVALALGVLVATASAALGFWLGSTRGVRSDGE